MKLTVIHLEGSKQGQTEEIPGPVVAVGRDPSNQLAFDPYQDLDVSTRHASITFQGQQVMLQDLGSKNGTFVNGQQIQGAVPLPDGSLVQFGDKGPKVKVNFTFETGPGKKTMMIHDLSSALESEKGTAQQAQKSKKRTAMMAGCLLFLGAIGVGGYLIYDSSATAEKLRVEVVGEDGEGGEIPADAVPMPCGLGSM